jgi:hypothetical protein
VWWLASGFGASGAAAAWSIRVIFDAVVLFWLANRLGIRFIRRSTPYFAAAVAIMALPLVALAWFGHLNAAVAMMAVVCFPVYSMIVWMKVLQAEEVAWLKGLAARYLPGRQ